MTPEQIRIAIAEKLGARYRRNFGHSSTLTFETNSDDDFYDGPWKEGDSLDSSIPDWPNDLNAVHEILKTLPEQESRDYFYHWLPLVVCPNTATPLDLRLANMAEAIQCCEALLRTWGLWKVPRKTKAANQ